MIGGRFANIISSVKAQIHIGRPFENQTISFANYDIYLNKSSLFQRMQEKARENYLTLVSSVTRLLRPENTLRLQGVATAASDSAHLSYSTKCQKIVHLCLGLKQRGKKKQGSGQRAEREAWAQIFDRGLPLEQSWESLASQGIVSVSQSVLILRLRLSHWTSVSNFCKPSSSSAQMQKKQF